MAILNVDLDGLVVIVGVRCDGEGDSPQQSKTLQNLAIFVSATFHSLMYVPVLLILRTSSDIISWIGYVEKRHGWTDSCLSAARLTWVSI